MKCFICGTEAERTTVLPVPQGGYIKWGHGCACDLPYHEVQEALDSGTLKLAIQPVTPDIGGETDDVADIYDSPDADLDPHAFFPRR